MKTKEEVLQIITLAVCNEEEYIVHDTEDGRGIEFPESEVLWISSDWNTLRYKDEAPYLLDDADQDRIISCMKVLF